MATGNAADAICILTSMEKEGRSRLGISTNTVSIQLNEK